MVDIGDQFGRYVVIAKDKLIRYSNHSSTSNQTWLCRCDCGKIVTVRQSNLVTGHSKSCGCWSNELKSQRRTHGESNKTKEYSIWLGIRRRCCEETYHAYGNYGARGIKMYEPWRVSYKEFLNYVLVNIGRCPTLWHSIDRINNDGNYEPGNIRWATAMEQSRNKRINVWIEFNGKKMILQDWANEYGILSDTLAWRLKHGYKIEDALSQRKYRRLTHV